MTNKEVETAWVRSYPIEAIYLANLARGRLQRRLKKRYPLLPDDRQPKHPQNVMSLFVKSRYAELGRSNPSGAFASISREWRALSEAEKQEWRARTQAGRPQHDAELKALKERARAYLKENNLKLL